MTAYASDPAKQDGPPTCTKVRAIRMWPGVAVGRCAGQCNGLPVVPEQRACATSWPGNRLTITRLFQAWGQDGQLGRYNGFIVAKCRLGCFTFSHSSQCD